MENKQKGESQHREAKFQLLLKKSQFNQEWRIDITCEKKVKKNCCERKEYTVKTYKDSEVANIGI